MGNLYLWRKRREAKPAATVVNATTSKTKPNQCDGPLIMDVAMKADFRNLVFDCHPMFYKVQGSTNIKICAQFVEVEVEDI